MANTPTTNYGFNKPGIGDSGWGLTWNANLDSVDATVKAVSDVAAAKASKSGDTFTGRVITKSTAADVVALGNWTGVPSIDLSSANAFTATLTGAVTNITLLGTQASKVNAFVLKLTNGGAFSIAWPAVILWPNAATGPSLTTTGTDVLAFITFDGGTSWSGHVAQLNIG